MKRRLFPAPVLSAGLFGLWLLLNPVTAGHTLLAVVVAVLVPAATARLRPSRPRVRHPLRIIRLVGVVVFDMWVASFRVVWLLLTRKSAALPSAFVKVPLELTDAHGLAVLATIVCFTPGTAWAELASDRRLLLLHVLEVQDEPALVASIKARYERPLREIFE